MRIPILIVVAASAALAYAYALSVTTVNQDTAVVLGGSIASGAVEAVNDSDNKYWELKPGIKFSSTAAPISVVFAGSAPGTTPSKLELVIESKPSEKNIGQTIEVYNYKNGSFTAMSAPTFVAFGPTADSTMKLALSSANIEPKTMEVKVRLSYKPTGALFSTVWKVMIDKIAWNYTE